MKHNGNFIKYLPAAIRYIKFLFASIIFTACNTGGFDLFDDFSGYQPIVKIESVKMSGTKTVSVVCKILDPGQSSIQFAGICMSQDSNPIMPNNQVLGTIISKNRYQSLYNDLIPKDTYYFRPFATNDYGYVYGDVVKFIVSSPEPPKIPCTLQLNNIFFLSTNYNVLNVSAGPAYATKGVWGVYVKTPYPNVMGSMEMDFNSIPDNGEYYCEEESLFSHPDDVIVTFHTGESYEVLRGSKVYVEKDDAGKYKISFCSLRYKFTHDTLASYGSFEIPK